MKNLNLDDLAEGTLGLTPALGKTKAEAASHCLEIQGHKPGVQMDASDKQYPSYTLTWSDVTEQIRKSWSDIQEAVEEGAVGIAILLVKDLTGLQVIERARKGTGFDYWLGDQAASLFQQAGRLEASGILSENDKNNLAIRMKIKSAQVSISDSLRIPAYVVVVSFGQPGFAFAVIQ